MILMAYALLKESKAASREEIREVIAGNLCRCTGYTKIVDAVESYVHAGRTHQPSAKVAGAEGIGGSDVS
jgi:carbon-monoxide dehydrogenase small subunit